jgi:hypothetical protein
MEFRDGRGREEKHKRKQKILATNRSVQWQIIDQPEIFEMGRKKR